MAQKNYIYDAGRMHSPPTRRHPVTKKIEHLPFTVPVRDARGRPARRWVLMCDTEGNTVRVSLTTGASEPFPTGTYAERKKLKMERAGWFEYGRCPRVLAQLGEFDANQLEDEVRKLPPCDGATGDDHPCTCAQLERRLRQARHRGAEIKRSQAWKPEADKIIAAQNDTTKAVLELVRAIGTKEAQGASSHFTDAIAAVRRMRPELTEEDAKGYIERQVLAALEQLEAGSGGTPEESDGGAPAGDVSIPLSAFETPKAAADEPSSPKGGKKK